MTEYQDGREDDRDSKPKKTDPRALAIVLAFGLVLLLLVVLNRN